MSARTLFWPEAGFSLFVRMSSVI